MLDTLLTGCPYRGWSQSGRGQSWAEGESHRRPVDGPSVGLPLGVGVPYPLSISSPVSLAHGTGAQPVPTYAPPCWALSKGGELRGRNFSYLTMDLLQNKNKKEKETKTKQLSDIEAAGVSDADAPMSSSETRGEDFTEETLLANLALESPRETDSSAAGPLSSPMDPTEEARLLHQSDSDLEGTLGVTPQPVSGASLDTTIRERPKRLSGAARRKRKKEKQRQSCSTAEGSTGGAASTSTQHIVLRGVQATEPSQIPSVSGTVPRGSEAEGVGGKKRPHVAGETPPGGTSAPPPKKTKQDYRAAVEKSLQVAVVFRDNLTRKMTAEEGQHVRSQIIRLIDILPVGTETQGPQFNRSGLDQGVFKITCADQHTLTWLKESVSSIEPIEECSFQVVKLSELYRLNKVKVWVPGVSSEPKLILSRISKQNRGLDTSEWRILHRQEKPDGQLLVLGVDDASLTALRNMGGKVHLELSRVTFELPSLSQEG